MLEGKGSLKESKTLSQKITNVSREHRHGYYLSQVVGDLQAYLMIAVGGDRHTHTLPKFSLYP